MRTDFLQPTLRRILQGNRGSALLIVLALVLLLTALIVTFLFRSGSSISISANSASTTRADIFGQGAVDTTIADLQQEIAAGSTATAYGTNTVYTPSNVTNMVAQVALPSTMVNTSSGTLPYSTTFPNLVKMSTPGVPFSAGDTSNSGQGRAAGSTTSGVTTTASLNGVSISTSSWNKALLLPKATTTSTYNLSPASGFVAPNWILVARDGSNPATWNTNMEAIPANVAAITPVVGRYAYMIYNEGGLLDANVAGSPYNSGYSSVASYKNALAYADLTQLGLSTADINALVGWRNYASAQVTAGSFPSSSSGTFPPNYTFPSFSAVPTAFDLATLLNLTGYLRTANSALVGSQSDRMFLSRQQLIHFFETIDPTNLSNMQNVLQYLGTFSRGLSQPSYVSPTSLPGSTAPTVIAGTGGNDDATDGTDAQINPAFLAARATTAFTRNDGSTAVINEPLVKKRFALNRLAWLTYAGPSANRNGVATGTTAASTVNGPDFDIYQLENQYGITQAFLVQGTAQNIYNYFGLSWVSDPNNSGSSEWVYNHSGSAPTTSNAPPFARINILSNITGREPDFFELLKAGICVGSIGKAYGDYTVAQTANTQYAPQNLATGGPIWYQAVRDRSIDTAIMQIGANIISQYQPSGYPARILANNNSNFSAVQEYRGVEDLPYVYRLREGKIRVTDSGSTPLSGTYTYTNLPQVTSGGTAPRLRRRSAGAGNLESSRFKAHGSQFHELCRCQSATNEFPNHRYNRRS